MVKISVGIGGNEEKLWKITDSWLDNGASAADNHGCVQVV